MRYTGEVPTVKQPLEIIKAKSAVSMRAAYAASETRSAGLLAAQDPAQAPARRRRPGRPAIRVAKAADRPQWALGPT